jgi:hypothetical protein
MASKLTQELRMMFVSTHGQENTLSSVIIFFQENDYLKNNKRRETWN